GADARTARNQGRRLHCKVPAPPAPFPWLTGKNGGKWKQALVPLGNDLNSPSPQLPGVFFRQRAISRRSPAGVTGGSACQSGSVFNTAASVIDTSSPSNGRRPVTIS